MLGSEALDNHLALTTLNLAASRRIADTNAGHIVGGASVGGRNTARGPNVDGVTCIFGPRSNLPILPWRSLLVGSFLDWRRGTWVHSPGQLGNGHS